MRPIKLTLSQLLPGRTQRQCPAPTKTSRPCPFPPAPGSRYCRVHRARHDGPPGPLAAA